MSIVFADSHYWIAVANPRDPWHEAARKARAALGRAILFTTDEVLTEFLSGMSKGGPRLRQAAVRMVSAILANPDVRVLPQSHDTFLLGLDRYASREDKEYSLTDRVSMNSMQTHGIREILTNDHHFEQEGFTVLVRKAGSRKPSR